MHIFALWITVPAFLLGLLVATPVKAAPLAHAASRDGQAPVLVAGATDRKDADDAEATEAMQPKADPKRQLTVREKRERAALEQRRLLQEKATRARIRRNQQNLDALRDDPAERLRLQQETQRRMMDQQRQLAQPQQPGQVPRLTPLDPPLMDQRNPRCGVPGMPLC